MSAGPPRIFVGTLACGEAELGECTAAIAAQEGVVVEHLVISDLPELEAHNRLWSAWRERRGRHDLFVKVDADTILARGTALAEVAALFADPDVTGAQVLLHDYFTDTLIAGLNAFSPVVEFGEAGNRLFPDRVDTGHRVVLKGEATRHLAPIGWHCRAPHPRQAFHFGLHRQLKKQRDVIARVARAWLAAPDEGRGWALAGASAAGWWLRGHFDYADKRFTRSFERLAADDAARRARVEDFARKAIAMESP